MIDLGAPYPFLQLGLLLRQGLVQLLETVEGGFERSDIRFRVECIVGEPGTAAGGYAALGESLYEVLDDEVFTLLAAAPPGQPEA